MDTPEEMRRKEVSRLHAQLSELKGMEERYIDTIKSLTDSLETAHSLNIQLKRAHLNACNAYDALMDQIKESGEYKKGFWAGKSERSETDRLERDGMCKSHADEVSVLIQTVDELKAELYKHAPDFHLLANYNPLVVEAMERIIPKD